MILADTILTINFPAAIVISVFIFCVCSLLHALIKKK